MSPDAELRDDIVHEVREIIQEELRPIKTILDEIHRLIKELSGMPEEGLDGDNFYPP